MKYNIQLQRTKRTDPNYVAIRDRHYVANNGQIGRQLHYLIYVDEDIVGIITGASCVYSVRARNNFFNILPENRTEKLNGIINNTVFRVETSFPNLGTQVLKLFRNQARADWYELYGDYVIGFETFVFGDNRTGAVYRADNWVYVGQTRGSAKKSKGMYGTKERITVPPKLIFCKKV